MILLKFARILGAASFLKGPTAPYRSAHRPHICHFALAVLLTSLCIPSHVHAALPTAINLSNNRIAENNAVNAVIGALTVTDPDAADTHTLSVVPSFGDDASFQIVGDKLQAKIAFNAESKSVYLLKIQAKTVGKNPEENLEQEVRIFVLDNNESSPNVSVASFSINEGLQVAVGTVAATDNDLRDKQLGASALFVSADIHNIRALADTLKNSPKEAAKYVANSVLSSSTYLLLAAFSPSSTDAAADSLKAAILANFNTALQGASIYTAARFPDADLTPRTKSLRDLNPTSGEALVRLNRRLLQDAFPEGLVNSLSFEITGGNSLTIAGGGVLAPFSIDPDTGTISSVTTLLNYEDAAQRSFSLTVKASDERSRESSAAVTINVQNVNEKPVIEYQSFEVDIDIARGSAIGPVAAADPDGNALAFTITAGDRKEGFEIKSDGKLYLKDQAIADLANNPVTSLTVKAEDPSGLFDSTTIDIFATNPEIPNGSPVMARLAGSNVGTSPDPGPPIAKVASGDNGEIFVLGATEGDPTVTVFPSDLGAIQRIELFQASDPAFPKFKPLSFAAAGDFIFVAGERTDGLPHLIRVKVSDGALLASSATSLIKAGATIRAVTVKQTANGAFVFIAGTEKSGLAGDKDHYWAKLDANLALVGSAKKWGWNDSVTVAGDGKQKFSGVIGVGTYNVTTHQGASDVTAIAVDENGGVYVSGFWADSGSALKDVLKSAFSRNDIYDSPGAARSDAHIYGDYLTTGKRWLGNALPLSSFTHGLNSLAVAGYTVNFGAIVKPEVGYIAKFDETSQANTHYVQDTGYETRSRITDLQILKTTRGSFLYAVQEFTGLGSLGGSGDSTGYVAGNRSSLFSDVLASDPSSPEFTAEGGTMPAQRDVKVNKFATDLKAVNPQNARIKSSGNISVASLTVDRVGNVFVAGILPSVSVDFIQPDGSVGQTSGGGATKIFVAKTDASLGWQSLKLLGSEPYDPLAPALIQYQPARSSTLVAGNFASGIMTLQNEEDPDSPTPPPSNSVAAPAGKNVGFLTFLDGNGNFLEQKFIETESEFGRSVLDVFPWKGRQVAEPGRTYTVRVPEVIHVDAAGAILGNLELGASDEEKKRAVTRYVNTGYTVADTEIIGNSSSYTFVFREDIKITFHWRVEHAVEIAANLSGTGAQWFNSGETSSSAWALGREGEWRKTGALGLTSLAAGNPTPAVQKHWIPENEVFTGFIDGTAPDPSNPGIRYRVISFLATGSASLVTPATEWPVQPRQQIPQFVVTSPATLTYLWKPQFRVMASTSRSKSKDLPQIRTAPNFAAPSAGQTGFGSGEHWFDQGAGIRVGGVTSSVLGQLNGWTFGEGSPFAKSSGSSADLTVAGAFAYVPNPALETPATSASDVSKGIQQPVIVNWDYGARLYPVSRDIGQFLTPTTSGALDVPPDLTLYNIAHPPIVTVISGPAGSTPQDIQVWDDVTLSSFPLRPGRFLLEFPHLGSPDTIDPLVFQVTSQFPTQPHYRHIAHPAMPGVALDPDPEDAYFFRALKYSELGSGNVANGLFFSQQEARHVLLFSRSVPGQIANGDLSRETTVVRVVETRVWDSSPTAGGLGAWTNPITQDPVTGARTASAGAPSLVVPASAPAIIGQRLAGAPFDRAGLGTGFVVKERATYNPNIYDRSQVADAGPIIPVNQQFTVDPEDDLVVVWYEPSPDGAVQPSNLLWPWQAVSYSNIQWPANPGRIVIASRLGSEGVDAAGQDQLVFSPDLYEAVRIYHQPDRTLPGFNPNEEHALIAPSFKFLGQANSPPAAFALRDGDLNVTTPNAAYTSHPFVLVEYRDLEADEFKMAVYSIEKEDDTYTRTSPYRFPEIDPNPGVAGDQREFPYVFDYNMKAGEPVQPPYPLGLVIGLTPCSQSYGLNGNVNHVTYWEDYRGQAWAVSEGRLLARFYYPLLVDFWNQEGANAVPPGACVAFLPSTPAPAPANAKLTLAGEVPEPSFTAGASFTVRIGAAGPPITVTVTDLADPKNGALNKADFVASVQTLNQADLSSRTTAANTVALVFQTSGQVTLTDGASRPLAAAGIIPGARSASELVLIGTSSQPLLETSDAFKLNGVSIVITDVDGAAGLTAADAAKAITTAFPAPNNLSASVDLGGHLRLLSSSGGPIELEDGVGQPLLELGFTSGAHSHPAPVAAQPLAVTYRAVWPTNLPILKLGETLTYAGGEFRADNPSAPGLPGVVAWAAGELLFDSLNPAMDNQRALRTQGYTARLISPLEAISVPLSTTLATDLETAIAPATGVTSVDGTVWLFTELSASLGKRIYYDPLNNELGLLGYLNDLTLGDSTLTASPPPVYLLEPNILTARERDELLALEGAKEVAGWDTAVLKLYALSRNPEQLHAPGESPLLQDGSDIYYAGYHVGLERDVLKDGNGELVLDSDGNPIPDLETTGQPRKALGPGLALVPGPALLDPSNPFERGYITLAENNDADIGGPVSLFIIKLEKKHRYRGAIKTILADNVFAEQITLRHTGDFGANSEDLVYQWFYREEDGATAPLPPASPWRVFLDQSDSPIKGLGLYEISLEGTGGLLLADNLFFVRYRHKNDVPLSGNNSVDWAGKDTDNNPANDRLLKSQYNTEWWRDGQLAAVLDRSGQPVRGSDGRIQQIQAGQWAGAANSPSVDGVYLPQLAQGWIKRVLDRVNPFEARFSDFRSTDVPATYASMVLQAGRRYEGPVALNPDKNVIENVGLIELYETILDRGLSLSLGLSSPISTPGVNNALLLAATRISDLYRMLGNEAFADAQDPTIGFGSDSADFASAASSAFPFQNQVPSVIDEELSLLRGVPESFGRPVYNRLFWNFTKSDGEAAYALNYNISDQNLDGFVDESDAAVLFPQGHGDAWGHYTTALKSHYRLLANPFFNWVSRSERYNLLDVVIDVDYLDERRFAETAAARAKTGAEIVDLTYRSRYLADPDGQWQGYTDTDPDRAWGVQGWARRAGQAALFDWMTANVLIPSEDPANEGVVNEALKKIDRQTVTSIQTISAQLGRIQTTYDNANTGLNPLGLADGVVPFDVTPDKIDDRVFGLTHFEQIYERAEKALANAAATFEHASEHKHRTRQQQLTADSIFDETYQQDRDYRNRLIEIFGTPYEGAIGAGLPYPAGYAGPDLLFFMYVDVSSFVNGVPRALVPEGKTAGNFQVSFQGLKQVLDTIKGTTDPNSLVVDAAFPFFVNDAATGSFVGTGNQALPGLNLWTGIGAPSGDANMVLNMPVTADGYTFAAPETWGRRGSPGELQSIISEMLQAEADLALSLGDYDNYLKELQDKADLLQAKYGLLASTVQLKNEQFKAKTSLDSLITAFKIAKTGLDLQAGDAKNTFEGIDKGVPSIAGTANDIGFGAKLTIALARNVGVKILEALAFASFNEAAALELVRDSITASIDMRIEKEGFKYEIREQLKDIEQHLRNEGTTRMEVFRRLEVLRQVSDRYRSVLSSGLALLDEREDFNKTTSATIQQVRYQDMAFRIFRNDVIQKYRAAYDLAARYVFLAAQAYDYETNLDPNDPGSAQPILTDIVRARSLGRIGDAGPQHGSGLAGALAALRDNYGVLKGQLGINNPQTETGKFSLRHELFRIQTSGAGDAAWRQVLAEHRVANLWQVPEFRKYCRPFAPQGSTPEPGYVIDFPTQILSRFNVFGQPLGGGDHAYDPSNFATKIRSVGVWFSGYPDSSLALTPRVYLVPVGADIMTIPNSSRLQTRSWSVVDQSIPVPFPVGDNELKNPNWIPVIDSLSGPLAAVRRFSSFRAHGELQDADGVIYEDELTYDTRLVGRSVWNTKWLLIIPGSSLKNDPNQGLDDFANAVSDIKLYFQTYGYSGN